MLSNESLKEIAPRINQVLEHARKVGDEVPVYGALLLLASDDEAIVDDWTRVYNMEIRPLSDESEKIGGKIKAAGDRLRAAGVVTHPTY